MQLGGCTTNSLREALRVLSQAEELLAAPERWTKGAWARDDRGAPVVSVSDAAVAWCVAGAVVRVNEDLFGSSRVRVSLDAQTKSPVAVHGPKRLVLALRLLALPVALAVFSARKESTGVKVRVGTARAFDVDLSAVAVCVNDLQETSHAHVLFALAWAIGEVRAELSDRRRAGEEAGR